MYVSYISLWPKILGYYFKAIWHIPIWNALVIRSSVFPPTSALRTSYIFKLLFSTLRKNK